MMKLGKILVGLCTLTMAVVWAVPAVAQAADAKEKPLMYSYVGNWAIPRAQWADMDKSRVDDQKLLDKAISDGTLIGYGDDLNLVHQPDGETHDDWWSSMSLAGVLNVLDQFYKSGNSTSPVLSSATRHWDDIYVSHYYNWHPGSYKGVYTHGSSYKLKADAPEDALDSIAKNFFVPVLEKMLANGTIHEYEIDTQAIHTQDPATFWVFFITANADGTEKVIAALRESMKANPMSRPAFDSMIDFTAHRDYMARTNATYK